MKIHSVSYNAVDKAANDKISHSEEIIITNDFDVESFELVHNGAAATILIDKHISHKLISIAANHLAKDFFSVTGVRPSISQAEKHDLSNAVIIGTVGGSALIDDLARQDKLDVLPIRNLWESYTIQTVHNPMVGVQSALVIAGSDPRGTAYGVYELSEKIGVSPWHWWADVKPDPKSSLFVKPCCVFHGPPSIKYRGIFINDESWGLVRWASETYAPEEATKGTGLGPKTYAKIYELLLRMKANFLCPGMHVATRPYNYYPENKEVADDYAIVIGSSHCEPMLRNNEGEWDINEDGPWRYDANRERIYSYWEKRVKENAEYENIYTLGMRGVHDSPMIGPESTSDKLRLLDHIIADQRKMLTKWVHNEVSQVPQALYLYKEVLDLYRNGLRIPDDITVIWPDDNHGYIKQLPGPDDAARTGGNGVYYHVSYYGKPEGYLWLCSTPLALIAEEMTKAYRHHAREVWVLNVGNFKLHEVAMEFFCRMAWDIKKWNMDTVWNYYLYWAKREFGDEYAEDIANIKEEYFRLNYIRKPEQMAFGLFNHTAYGDEAQKRIDAYEELLARAEKIHALLPHHKRDCFYELVLYSLRCSKYMASKYLYAEKSNLYALQQRTIANSYAEKTIKAYNNIKQETDFFNKKLAGGKWNLVVSWSPHGTTGWTRAYDLPSVSSVEPEAGMKSGIAVEEQPFTHEDNPSHCYRLPLLDVYTKTSRFIDIFNKGSKPIPFELIKGHEWISLSQTQGLVSEAVRLWINADWENAPKSNHTTSYLLVSLPNETYRIEIDLRNPSSPIPSDMPAIVESDGYVSMKACDFTRNIAYRDSRWKAVRGLGRTGNAVLADFANPIINQRKAVSGPPCLEYEIYFFSSGTFRVSVECLPTHNVDGKPYLQYAVSFDDDSQQTVRFEACEESSAWSQSVLRSVIVSASEHTIATPGKHTLKVWMRDTGVVLDKIIIDTGNIRETYLSPPPSTVRI